MNWMLQALELAKKGIYTCSPNPMVGCVIVNNNKIVGQGFHKTAGKNHAEINALQEAGSSAAGADVYLTLEPCSHHGRTPPCVDSLIQAKVSSVHIALKDPNKLVSGRGIQKLKQAGIKTYIGEQAEAAFQLNRDFFHYITQQSPYVLAKWAMTLDGKITNANGDSKWITSEKARAHAHSLRAQVDAVLVGGQTFRNDLPRLTCRSEEIAEVKQPRPIVVSASGNIPLAIEHLRSLQNPIFIISEDVKGTTIDKLMKSGAHIYKFPLKDKQFQFQEILEVLAEKEEIKSLLVEGGSQILTSFYQQKLVHEVYAYIAPKIMGGWDSLSPIEGETVNNNQLFEELHSSEIIALDKDVCVYAKTTQAPANYKEFINSQKDQLCSVAS